VIKSNKLYFFIIYFILLFFIPVDRRVKGHTIFVENYVKGASKRFKVYIFLIRINSRVDLAKSVSAYERRDLRNYKS